VVPVPQAGKRFVIVLGSYELTPLSATHPLSRATRIEKTAWNKICEADV